MPEQERKLGEMIRDIRIAMLTTIDAEGVLRSRPMATREGGEDDGGRLWFLTARNSGKVSEIRTHDQVGLSYSDPDGDRYVSVSGFAEVVEDRDRIRELWSPAYKGWFPGGSDDPELVALCVHVEHAEAWDAPSRTMAAIAGFVKATLTGRPHQGGEHISVDHND